MPVVRWVLTAMTAYTTLLLDSFCNNDSSRGPTENVCVRFVQRPMSELFKTYSEEDGNKKRRKHWAEQ